ncbi:MAG: MBL fold metallo-hydrolase [Planctomycetota bacterium]|jgi:glyoxylase-like metal-dependent hydrolase (beta-lactamase superfamily II)|nr:MBL fold metallo-hydrolase [Planctomycetota bacterium]
MEPCTEQIEIVKLTVGPFLENTYIVACRKTGQAILIDPGDEPERIITAIDEKGFQPIRITNTHAHLDHIGAVAAIQKHYNIPFALHPADRPLIDIASQSAMMFGLPAPEPFEIDEDLDPDIPVQVGEITFQVLFVPGHAPGHVAFFSEKHQIVFSGDCLFAGSIGRTDLPYCDHDTLMKSIRDVLLPLGNDVTVYPGHEANTTIGRERATNPFLVNS